MLSYRVHGPCGTDSDAAGDTVQARQTGWVAGRVGMRSETPVAGDTGWGGAWGGAGQLGGCRGPWASASAGTQPVSPRCSRPSPSTPPGADGSCWDRGRAHRVPGEGVERRLSPGWLSVGCVLHNEPVTLS